MDTIKIAAYNSEQWLLERLEHHYDNPRDILQVLQIFTQLRGRLELCDHQFIVTLMPPEVPRFRKALEGQACPHKGCHFLC